MTTWTTKPLGELFYFQRGFDLPKSKMTPGPYPVIGSNGIIGWHNEYTTTAPGVTIGRSGNVGMPFICRTNSWSHNTTLFVKDFKDNDPFFIYHFLKTLNLKEYAGGSAVPTLNRNHIHNLQITIPDINAQKKIANVLNAFDNKIAINSHINDYLAQLCEVVVGKYCESGTDCLGDICYQVTDKANCEDADLDTYVSTESLLQNKRGRQQATSLPATGKVTRYATGDTLVSNIRPYFKKVWYAPFDGTCSGDVLVFRANSIEYAPYLHACLRQDRFFDHVMRGAKGTKMPRGDKKQMMEFNVSATCRSEDLSLLNVALSQIAANDAESTGLGELRATLLPKLMSGEIDVSKVKLPMQLNNHLYGYSTQLRHQICSKY